MEETPPQSPRCRLCLTTFRDQSDDLLDIFRDQEADFSLKIRDCTGVFVSPEDDDSAAATICTNCTETVHFIAEFRDLCRRSEERCVAWFDPQRWEAYRHHVGELRRLLSTTDSEEGGYFKPMVAVKLEQEEQQADVAFEWADAGDALEMKFEVDEGEREDYLEEEEDVPKRKKVTRKAGKLSEPSSAKENVTTQAPDERMQLAEAIYKREIIWNRSHPNYKKIFERDMSFEELAVEMNISAPALKQKWKNLRDFYRIRCSRVMKGKLDLDSATLQQPLYLLLDKMLRDNIEVGKRYARVNAVEEREESTTDASALRNDKLAMAQAFYERDFIWKRHHPTNATKATREAAWREAAQELNMTVPELQNEWRKLRYYYRVNRKRLQAKPDDEAAVPATPNPLYTLMEQMVCDVSPSLPNQPTLKAKRQRADADRRLSIAVAVHEQEILWNKAHPDFTDLEERDRMWQRVATQLSIPYAELKKQWKLLRDLYRSRIIRIASGEIPRNHPLLRQKLFGLLDQMLHDNIKVSKRGKAQVLMRRKKEEKKEEGHEIDLEFQGKNEEEEEKEAVEKPFEDKELRARLAEEITKHEMLWNVNHVDYSQVNLRGKLWTEIGNLFGLDRSHAVMAWRHAAHRHRRLIELHGSVTPELLEQDPLHRMLHEVVYKAIDGEPREQLKKLWPPKRRFTGKKSYSSEGCVKVIQNGSSRYFRVCELCGKNVERSEFEYHMNKHNGLTPYACSYEGCDKRYGSKITRDRHEVLVHTSAAERFECEECGEKFNYRSKLEYHHAVNHKSQNLPCSICGKEMKHKRALHNHIQKVHQQSGFGCSICNRVYQTKYSLKEHMRIHTNEKPFPCVLCGQCFRLKVSLRTHLTKVHNVSIEELEGPGPSGSGN